MSNDSSCALVTGGNGNLGRLVTARLLARGQQVISFDLPGTWGVADLESAGGGGQGRPRDRTRWRRSEDPRRSVGHP